MGIIEAIKEKAAALDKTYNPLRKVGDAVGAATEKAKAAGAAAPSPKVAEDPGRKAEREARARGEAARQEAVNRGKAPQIPMKTIDSKVREIPW